MQTKIDKQELFENVIDKHAILLLYTYEDLEKPDILLLYF